MYTLCARKHISNGMLLPPDVIEKLRMMLRMIEIEIEIENIFTTSQRVRP